MISVVKQEDIKEIEDLVSRSIYKCIDVALDIANELIRNTVQESEWWLNNTDKGVHLAYWNNDKILGVVLIKEYWNMTSLFVCTSIQKSGVASKLTESALNICREYSPINSVKLNSSSYASGFYSKFGFKSNGVPKDLPGGCIPYVYSF